MNLNYASVGAACLAVGIGGFVAWKFSISGSAPTEAEKLLSRADQAAEKRMGENRGTGARSASARSRANGSNFDERLNSMEDIIRGKNAFDRGRALLSWIDSLAAEEFESAVNRFLSLGLTDDRMGEYEMLLSAWAELDPTAALAFTKERNWNGKAMGMVMNAWAGRDPESAIAWAKANHEGDGANPYFAGIIHALAETNPTRATELLQELPYGRECSEAIDAMKPHLMKMDVESAKGWISGLNDELARDHAIGLVGHSLAKDDPEGTANWLIATCSDLPNCSALNVAFSEWANTDPSAAKNSFENLPKGAARTQALHGIVAVEIAKNPQDAANLMNSFPDDVDDLMIERLNLSTYQKTPELSINQIGNMEDPSNRDYMYKLTLKSWLKRDEAAAQSWINNANLSEDVLKSLENRNQP